MTAEKFCNQYGLGGSDRFTVKKMLGSKDMTEAEFKVDAVKVCGLNPKLFEPKVTPAVGKVVPSKKSSVDSSK